MRRRARGRSRWRSEPASSKSQDSSRASGTEGRVPSPDGSKRPTWGCMDRWGEVRILALKMAVGAPDQLDVLKVPAGTETEKQPRMLQIAPHEGHFTTICPTGTARQVHRALLRHRTRGGFSRRAWKGSRENRGPLSGRLMNGRQTPRGQRCACEHVPSLASVLPLLRLTSGPR